MTVLDWTICGLYLALIALQGWWFSGRQSSNEEYFVGSRRINWGAVGISVFATNFSALSFVGLLREAAYEDYHLFLAKLLVPLAVVPVVAWVFIPIYQRIQLISAYEYLGRRFDRRVRLIGSALFSLYTLGWMGTMLYAAGLILQSVLGLDDTGMVWAIVAVGLFTTAYATAGGIRAIVWTDLSQSIVLGGAMLTILVLALQKIDGGLHTVWATGVEHGKFQMFDFRFDLSVRGNFYSACAYGFFVYLAHHAISQSYVQRYVSTRDVGAARRSLAVHSVLLVVACLLFFVLGTTIFTYYQLHPHSPGQAFPVLASQDQLATHFVLAELATPGLLGLLMAGLLTAMMSSIDSGINNLAAVLTFDWFSGRNPSVKQSRLISLGFGGAAIVTALATPLVGTHVFDIIIRLGGALFGPLLGLFALGMFSSRSNTGGALVGLAAGITALLIATQTEVSHWWYGAFTSVSTFAVGFSASLLFSPPSDAVLDGLIVGSTRHR